MEDLDRIAGSIYRPETMSAGLDYLKSRGVSEDVVIYPVARTGGGSYVELSDVAKPFLFTDSVFFPVPSVVSALGGSVCLDLPCVLSGFDVRYIGSSERRTRFLKFVRRYEGGSAYPNVFMQRSNNTALWDQTAILVCEGYIDALSVLEALKGSELNVLVVSPLTARADMIFLGFLYALSARDIGLDKKKVIPILLAYDNDEAGLGALGRMYDLAMKCGVDSLGGKLQKVRYRGKDPNECLCNYGSRMLLESVMDALSDQGVL